jgi:hypothetical protein
MRNPQPTHFFFFFFKKRFPDRKRRNLKKKKSYGSSRLVHLLGACVCVRSLTFWPASSTFTTFFSSSSYILYISSRKCNSILVFCRFLNFVIFPTESCFHDHAELLYFFPSLDRKNFFGVLKIKKKERKNLDPAEF